MNESVSFCASKIAFINNVKDFLKGRDNGDFANKILERSSASIFQNPSIPDELKNPDNFDLAVSVIHAGYVNKLNENGEGMSAETASRVVKKFKFKPQTIEHDNSKTVGFSFDYAWGDESGNILDISDEEIKSSKGVFSIFLIGVIWKYIDPKFAAAIENSADESNQYFKTIGASWEILFDKFVILKGSEILFGEGAEVISDQEEIKFLRPHLKKFKGSGKDPRDGKSIGRIIHSENDEDVLPVAVSYTTNPASGFKGVDVYNFSYEQDGEEIDEPDFQLASSDEFHKESYIKDLALEKSAASFIQNDIFLEKKDENNVITPKEKINFEMKIKNIEQLIELLPEDSRSSASDFVTEQLEIKAKEFQKAVEEKESMLSKATSQNEELQEKLKELQSTVESLNSSLSLMKEESAAKESQEAFNLRMGSLDQEFLLSDSDREIIASEILGLNEESYSSWFKKFNSFASEKKRSVIEERNALIEKEKKAVAEKHAEASKASVETPQEEVEQEDKSELLEKLEKLPNQSIANAETPSDYESSWKNAFSKESVKVNF